MSALQERRLRELRSRMLVRAFDHRQRRHARGVWFRLRRALTFAEEAYALPPDEAKRLLAQGYRPEPVSRELEPPRVLLFVPAARVARMGGMGEVSRARDPRRRARRALPGDGAHAGRDVIRVVLNGFDMLRAGATQQAER